MNVEVGYMGKIGVEGEFKMVQMSTTETSTEEDEQQTRGNCLND